MPGIGARYPELGRRITRREYDKVVDFALQIGITNAFVQEGETAKESFIPEFDGTGL
jgi:putative pyruvate formate lyase activating enzyme